MQVTRVTTNETCNLACRFCNTRRATERSSVAGAQAVRAAIDRSIQQASTAPGELVLTGGEPTLRPDLEKIVAYARKQGSTRIVLETNGTRLDVPDIGRLHAAGVDVVRVHLPAWGDELDNFYQQRDIFTQVFSCLVAAQHSQVELQTATPVVAANLPNVAALPLRLHDAGIVPERCWLSLPNVSPTASALAPARAGLVAIEAFALNAQRVGLSAALDPATYVPPCTFERPARVTSLFALNRGARRRQGYAQVSLCDSCELNTQCPGLPEQWDKRLPLRPITTKGLRRRLTVIGTASQQAERELVTHEHYRRQDGSTVAAAIIRINFHCNQACGFCFVSTHLPDPARARIEQEIDNIAERRGVAVFSGGEPTLNANLLEYVRRAKDAGACEVELQTNATRLGEDVLTQRLKHAGVDTAFVSLHGATAATSDAVTSAPGTFVKTLVGLDKLATHGIAVRVNFVICGRNFAEFPAFIDLVAMRWPKAAVTVSFVASSTDLVPRTRELMPQYSQVLPALRAGLERAADCGIEIGGFDSMCGLPLCLVAGAKRGRSSSWLHAFLELAPTQANTDGGEFLKPDVCARCVLETRCFGIRRGYAQLYGTEELEPVLERP